MDFRNDIRDLKFIIAEWLPAEEIFACERFRNNFSLRADPQIPLRFLACGSGGEALTNPAECGGMLQGSLFNDRKGKCGGQGW
jgi:hypothetical protein